MLYQSKGIRNTIEIKNCIIESKWIENTRGGTKKEHLSLYDVINMQIPQNASML